MRVLSFHYVLTNNQGQTIDTSRGGESFPVLEGQKQILPALEKELFAMKPGDQKQVFLKADQAYGVINEQLKVQVPREKLPPGDIKIGTQFQAGEGSHRIFTVLKVETDKVFLDGNHPLAGQDLNFDVEVMEIRAATEEEKQHGHAHGVHGHSH